MNKAIYVLIGMVIIAALIYLIVLRVAPSKPNGTERVTCGSKTILIYKNPDEAFPMFTSNFNVSLKLASGVLRKITNDTSTSVSLDTKSNAAMLTQQLDQDNILVQTSFKAVFIASNNDPCNDSLRYLYTQFVENMSEKELQYKQFVANATTPAGTATANDTAGKTVMAAVDTAKGKVDTSAEAKQNIKPGNLVLIRNNQKINSAVTQLFRVHQPLQAPVKSRGQQLPAH